MAATNTVAHGATLRASFELGDWAEDPNGAGAVNHNRGFGVHVYRLPHRIAGERVHAPEAVFYQAYPCQAAYVMAEQAEDA